MSTNTPAAASNTASTSNAAPAPASNTARTTTTQSIAPYNTKKYELPFLEQEGANFASWKRLTQRALSLQKLWPVVDGSYPRPADGSMTLADWREMDEEVLGQIEFTLKPGPLNTISRTTTAKDAWDALCHRFEGKGKARVANLLGDVFKTVFVDSEPLEDQLNTFLNNISLINQIKGLDVFDDELTAVAMINALPDLLRLTAICAVKVLYNPEDQ
jgi:gag-polypeptide of LTR copia-type